MNLNDVRIVEERKKLWNICMRLIERGNRAFSQSKIPGMEKELETVIEEMLELLQQSAEFSATAKACFRGSSYKWVRELANSIA